MSRHSYMARELFEKGYNCSQSVFAAFCDETGMDSEEALKLSSSFGGGMGRLREVCGALTAVFMIAGIKYGYTENDNDAVKAKHYIMIQRLAEQFKNRNGSYICRALLGLGEGADEPEPEARTDAYYKTRPCAGLVEYAAEMMDDLILNINEWRKENEDCSSK